MQLFDLFICTQSALYVSGDVFAHHQEHLTVFTAYDIATVMIDFTIDGIVVFKFL